jgi:hypothetical protein
MVAVAGRWAAGLRIILITMPGADQPLPIELAFAERAALMGAAIIDGSKAILGGMDQADSGIPGDGRCHLPFGQLVHFGDFIPF